MEDTLEHKHIHVSKHLRGDWSFGVCLTHDDSLNETYIYINFFKWSISIGKLAYLKEIKEEI